MSSQNVSETVKAACLALRQAGRTLFTPSTEDQGKTPRPSKNDLYDHKPGSDHSEQ